MELTRAMAAGVAVVEGATVMPAPVFAIKRDGAPVQKTPLGVWRWNGARFEDEGGAERDELPEWPLWVTAAGVEAVEGDATHVEVVRDLERAVKVLQEKLRAMGRSRDEWEKRAIANGDAERKVTTVAAELEGLRREWKARAVAAEAALEMVGRNRDSSSPAELALAKLRLAQADEVQARIRCFARSGQDEKLLDLDAHRGPQTIPVGPEVEVAGIPDVVMGRRDQFGNEVLLVGGGE